MGFRVEVEMRAFVLLCLVAIALADDDAVGQPVAVVPEDEVTHVYPALPHGDPYANILDYEELARRLGGGASVQLGPVSAGFGGGLGFGGLNFGGGLGFGRPVYKNYYRYPYYYSHPYTTTYYSTAASRGLGGNVGLQLGPVGAELGANLGLSGVHFGGGLGLPGYYPRPYSYYSPSTYYYRPYSSGYCTVGSELTSEPTTTYTSVSSRNLGGGIGVQFGPLGAGLGAGFGPGGLKIGGGLGFKQYGHYGTPSHYRQYYQQHPEVLYG